MTALYVITKYLTFPGALVRGLWEHIVCRICKVPVEDNRIIRGNELSGHIEHELMPTARSAFAIAFVPAFLNAILAFLLLLGPALGLFMFEMSDIISTIVNIVSYWFAFSLYVNSYPLIEDALNMKEKVYKSGNIMQKIFYTPGFIGCYIGAFLERYCITFIIAVALTVLMVVGL